MLGIIGYGVLGQATAQLGEHCYFDPVRTASTEEAFAKKFVFICVPTNYDPETEDLDTTHILESVHRWNMYAPIDSICIIRSTVPPGTVDNLEFLFPDRKGRIIFWPEFLTERTANEDFRNQNDFVIGASDPSVAAKFVNDVIYPYFYTKKPLLHWTRLPPRSAEMVKLVRNAFYFLKVVFFNEVRRSFEDQEDYDLFISAVVNPWLHRQHTAVPGPDGKMGCGGKCLPKDAACLAKYISSTILEEAIAWNRCIRPNALPQ